MATAKQAERKNTFVSDQPSPFDYLDFKPYVSGLVDLITASETQTPLTLGIAGSWGSGKTTLMHLMEDEVLARVKKEKVRRLKCLWVNVWEVSQHGEGGQALLQALFTKVRSRLSLWRKLSFGWYLLRDRVNFTALLRQLAVNSYRVLIVIAPLVAVKFISPQNAQAAAVDEGKLSVGISALLGIWLLLKPLVEAAREKVSLDLGAVLDDAPYEIKVSALQKLKTHFKRLVEEWVGDDGRVIVFIDDLDRCSPDSIAETLEALKLFATTEGCVYVLGLDQEVVARSIQLKYKEISGEAGVGMPLEGVRYLEKIVQLPFLLPQIEVTDIRGYVNSFNAEWPHDGCADIFVEGLPPNPRQLKRAVNVFFLLWKLAKSRQEKLGPTVTPMRLAKIVALQMGYPDLFEWIKRAPHLLKELETFYQRGAEEQRLIVERQRDDGKRFEAATMRPGLKRLFELHVDDPLAKFGDLDLTDLATFFSLTRSVTLASAGANGSAAKSADAAASVETKKDVVVGDANVVSQTDKDAYTSSNYDTSPPPVSSLHQLPPPPRDFTGREAQLASIMSGIKKGEVAICSIEGLGGVGKTAFALKLAEQLTPDYPDAQFYLDLKGTSDKPLSVAEALTYIIRAYYATSSLGESEEELRSLYNSVLHGRRALLLMDNASGGEQVEPLIPPEGCLLVITTRQRFTLPGMATVSLDSLLPEDARALLLKIAPRVGDVEADEIIKLCGNLPLAVRLAASLLAERPDLSPADYVRRLSDGRGRLELVEASLSLSYEQLSPELQSLFRALAVFPDDFDPKAAAAVWEKETDAAQDALGKLLKFSIVEWRQARGRYRLHNLARLFADARLSEEERVAAQQRHALYYLEVVKETNRLYLEGGESLKAGLELFDSEWINIETGQAWAEKHLRESETAAQACSDYPLHGLNLLLLRLSVRERVSWLESALEAAGILNNREAEGLLLGSLGGTYVSLGDITRATEYLEKAIVLARETGDRQSEQLILDYLGQAYSNLGQLERAEELYERQLAITREIGDRRGEGKALGNLGFVKWQQGEPKEAGKLFERLLAIAREIGDTNLEGVALFNIGRAFLDLDNPQRGIEYFEQALAIMRELGDRNGEGNALLVMSHVYERKGDSERAIRFAEESLKILEEIESPQVHLVHEQLERLRSNAEESVKKSSDQGAR